MYICLYPLPLLDTNQWISSIWCQHAAHSSPEVGVTQPDRAYLCREDLWCIDIQQVEHPRGGTLAYQAEGGHHCAQTCLKTSQWRHNERDGVSNTDIPIVCSTLCSGTDQRKYQSSASLAFVRGIHRWQVDSPHKGLVTREKNHVQHETNNIYSGHIPSVGPETTIDVDMYGSLR